MNIDDKPTRATSASLAGARIWLSGAVPEIEGSTEEQRAAIVDFVRRFARQVFRRGGHIVHGSHPSLTPVLLEEAKCYQDRGGHKDRLVLAVSRHWSKDPEKVPTNDWRKTALVYETPEAAGDRARDDSLEILRKWLVSRCDAVVVVGGKWWQAVGGRAGVPVELELAIERGIPGFLLGGLGGAAQDYVAGHPEVFGKLKNGLDVATNREVALKSDVGALAEFVCIGLERLPWCEAEDRTGFRSEFWHLTVEV